MRLYKHAYMRTVIKLSLSNTLWLLQIHRNQHVAAEAQSSCPKAWVEEIYKALPSGPSAWGLHSYQLCTILVFFTLVVFGRDSSCQEVQ